MVYPNVLLKKGITHPSVKILKGQLNYFLRTKLDVNNAFFGQETEEIVKNFQKLKQLKSDGVVGELTWSKLFEEQKVANNPKTINLVALEIMRTQLFVREKTGKNDGVEVENYLKSVGLGKGYAWCMAFVFWGFEMAAEQLSVSNPLIKTAGVMRQWNENPTWRRVKEPKAGDIFIIDFGKGTGHTGIVSKVVGDKIFTIEGNTSSQPSSAVLDREGNGVFERSRKISSIKGFLRFEAS